MPKALKILCLAQVGLNPFSHSGKQLSCREWPVRLLDIGGQLFDSDSHSNWSPNCHLKVGSGLVAIGEPGASQRVQTGLGGFHSYRMMSMPLRNFGKSFKLPQSKELMPYKIYKKENI